MTFSNLFLRTACGRLLVRYRCVCLECLALVWIDEERGILRAQDYVLVLHAVMDAGSTKLDFDRKTLQIFRLPKPELDRRAFGKRDHDVLHK